MVDTKVSEEERRNKMIMESALIRSLWWIIPAALMVVLAVLERKWSK